MAFRRSIKVAAVAMALAILALGGAALAAQDDPVEKVAAVDLGQFSIAAGTDPTAAVDSAQQVAALDPIEGTLERRGDDPDDLVIGTVELELGPERWLRTAGPLRDYDGDGTPEDLRGELDALVGQAVTALVRLDDDGDEGDLYVLNDLVYRDSAGGPAPWQQGRTAREGASTLGQAASPEKVAEAAARAVGEGARVDELDREDGGAVAWEADVIAADGRERTVLLDAAGQVLDVRRDD